MIIDTPMGGPCAGQAAVMYPDPHDKAAVEAAKAICAACPPREFDKCLTILRGLADNEDPGGVIAGLSEEERGARARRPVPKGSRRCKDCHQIKPLARFASKGTSRSLACDTCSGDLQGSKKCLRCDLDKPLTEYSRDRSRHDGFSLYCEPCRRIIRTSGTVPDGQRTCKQCNTSRPIHDYAPRGNGYQHICKPCQGYTATAKPCTKCGAVKPLTEFNKSAAKPGGRQSACRDCQKAARNTAA
ncbi:WhiB family transcriptional regulator [Sphaerisporangium sp. NPDC004334]